MKASISEALELALEIMSSGRIDLAKRTIQEVKTCIDEGKPVFVNQSKKEIESLMEHTLNAEYEQAVVESEPPLELA